MLSHRVDGQQAKKQPCDGQRLFLDYVEAEIHVCRSDFSISIGADTWELIFCL